MKQNKLLTKPCFLPGTMLRPGAVGRSVELLQLRLKELKASGEIKTNPIGVFADRKGRFGQATSRALEEYLGKNFPHRRELTVDRRVWESLGLRVGESLEDFFDIINMPDNQTISLELTGSEVTLYYRPRLLIKPAGIFARRYNDREDKRLCLDHLKAALQGFLAWAPSDPVEIRGVQAKIKVVILDRNGTAFTPVWKQGGAEEPHPPRTLADTALLSEDGSFKYNFFASSKREANVLIELGTRGILTSMVFGAWLRWRPKSRLRMVIRNKTHTPPVWEDATFQHELGHVLGLFDAYSYKSHFPLGGRLFPGAKVDRKHIYSDSVMRCDYHQLDRRRCFYISPHDWEMVLWAFSQKRLQNYVKRPFARQSQSYFY